jgi:ankyrin repeat protein
VGFLPLLRASSSSDPSLEVVQLFVARFPDALQIANDLGCLPVHAAAKHGNLELVRVLVDGFSASLRKRDNTVNLPLHLAASGTDRGTASLDLVLYLADGFPEAPMSANKYGWLPLHSAALAQPTSARRIRCLAELRPASLAVADLEGSLPVHVAARYGTSADAVRFLAAMRPDTLLVQDNDGRLPLHVAMQGEPQFDIIQGLVEVGPDALLGRNEGGRLALHAAVHHGAPLPVIELLAEACPPSLREGDNDGYLPLHVASGKLEVRWGYIWSSRPTLDRLELVALETVRLLATACRSLPLHVAVRHAKLDVVRFLASAHPEALLAKAKDGCLPLHRAVERASLEVLQFLANACPDSLHVPANRRLQSVGCCRQSWVSGRSVLPRADLPERAASVARFIKGRLRSCLYSACVDLTKADKSTIELAGTRSRKVRE